MLACKPNELAELIVGAVVPFGFRANKDPRDRVMLSACSALVVERRRFHQMNGGFATSNCTICTSGQGRMRE